MNEPQDKELEGVAKALVFFGTLMGAGVGLITHSLGWGLITFVLFVFGTAILFEALEGSK